MKNLKEIREKKRITQIRLGTEIGISQETISAYESGKSMPSAETLCKMADFLNVSIGFLLDRTNISIPMKKLEHEGLTKNEIELTALVKSLSVTEQMKVMAFIQGLRDA